MLEYVTTMLTLLAQPDIEAVWYSWDGWHERKAITRDEVLALLDQYIRIGWN